MSIDKLKKDYELINIFCTLVKIASPSLKEDKVADKIINILKKNSIQAKKDSFGNVIGKISATDNSKKPILLSAHMDVVGDDSPVLIKLNGNFIETDKKRTLGADDDKLVLPLQYS
jgi:di/tripeptidase